MAAGREPLRLELTDAISQGLAERFDKFDANKDGYVSRDEMHNIRMKKKRGE